MKRALHAVWRVIKPVGAVFIALVIVLLAVLIPTLSGSEGDVKDNLSGVVVDSAATSGPIVGDQSLFKKESTCIKNYAQTPEANYAGYFPAIGAPEHTDNIRSGVQPCGTFTGSLEGDNQVFSYQSETTYPGGIGLVVFDGPDSGYLWAGGIVPGGTQYISKFNAATGKEIWRTYVANVNISGQWIALGSLALIEDGTLAAAAGHTFWKLDRQTGAIIASEEQPIVGTPAKDHNFDGMIVAPDGRGTLLNKSQTRAVGCPRPTARCRPVRTSTARTRRAISSRSIRRR